VELKTGSKFSLGVTVLFQVIGYALLGFDDAYRLTGVGIFSARYAHLTTRNLSALPEELAGQTVAADTLRPAFRVIRGFWRHAPGEEAGQRAGVW
jgi:hypothetical protein